MTPRLLAPTGCEQANGQPEHEDHRGMVRNACSRRESRFPRPTGLLSARGGQGCLRPHRSACVAATGEMAALQAPDRLEAAAAQVLRPRLEDRLQERGVYRRSQRQGDSLPLSRQHHPDPLDPDTGSHRLTSGTARGEPGARRRARRVRRAGTGRPTAERPQGVLSPTQLKRATGSGRPSAAS